MRADASRVGGRAVVRRLLSVLIALLIVPSAFSQEATEPALKAALALNFARFTVWPGEALPVNGVFTACIVGDMAIGQALERSTKERLLAGHRIVVTRPGESESLRLCHLLYVSGMSPAQVAKVLSGLRGAPVLTITDLEGPRTVGGIARVFIEDGRMRFDLDNGLAKQGHLQLSSKILTLASHVFDDSAAGER